MRRLLAILAVLGACAAAIVLTGADNPEAKGKKWYVEFDNAFGLVPGGDLKVGGTRVGKTNAFSITDEDTPKAVVELKVTQSSVSPFRKDASCEIRQQSLIGEYFVDCQPGSAQEELPEGGTIPVEQTSSAVPPDLVNNVMRRPYRERFRLILSELGTGLAGRPQELNEVVRRAHPGLRETNKVLAILARQNQIIKDFIADSDTVMVDLERVKRQVARWVKESGETAEIQATRREALAGTFRRFPTFLRELRPTMARLETAADEQTPLLRDLQRAAPDLLKFFQELGPFSEASRPAFRSLGRMSVTGRAALNESRDEIRELRALSANAPGFAKPLRQFLQTIDDRRRGVDDDRTAADTAPPSPDPTAYRPGSGFTGMEALFNFVFWQTLTINPMDELGHVLRILVVRTSACAPYEVRRIEDERTRQHYERCNSWLGPDQPGVNAPDPTRGEGDTTGPASAARRAGRKPEQEALPGQRDVSRPRPVLPPGVQELAESFRKPSGRTRGPDGDAPDQLLDFLLAP